MSGTTLTTRFRFWLWLIRLIGVIVPQRLRADWRQEWEAELRHREELLAEWDRLDWRNKLDLLRRSTSAFWDALWLQPKRLEDEMFQDLRFGLRMLVKHKGFTVVTVLTLALGISANTAIFSVVNGVLLRPLPYKEPQRLVMVWTARSLLQAQAGVSKSSVSAADFSDWRDQNQVLEQIAAFQSQSFNITGGGEPEYLGGVRASANLFPLLGVEARLGRTFLPEEDRAGSGRVVILGYGLWQRRFGSDPKIIGQTISLNDQSYTVIGVMPSGFQFPRKGDLPSGFQFPAEANFYTPLALTPEQRNNRGRNYLAVIARLKPKISLDQAQTEMTGIAERLRQQYPGTNRDRGVMLVGLHQQVVGKAQLALLVLLGAVGFVLLIACANVANLLLVRAVARQREMAIRAALGAGRWRVIRQLLTESVLLAVLSGLLAMLLASGSADLLQTILPDNLPRADQVGIDGRVFGFTLLISLLTGILFGLIPAFAASRLSLTDSLKDGGRGSRGIGHSRFRNLLLVSEVALAVVLLAGAGLMLRSFIKLMSVDPGFDPQNVLTMDIRLPRNRYAPVQQAVFFQQYLERLSALPGVEAAGAVYPLPFSGAEEGTGISIEGQPPPASSERRIVSPRWISPGYFKAMNIHLQRGRELSVSDGSDTPPVLVINEAMARQYWPNQDPIGRRVSFNSHDGQPVWREIVGVIRDVRHKALDQAPKPEMYVPFTQFPSWLMTIVARTKGDPLTFAAAVRSQVQAMDKDQPVSNIHTMEELMARSVSPPRFYLLLLAVFAGVALLLAAVGIYGVMSYLVTQRTHEIGVRMALGAQAGDVLKLVVKQGMTVTLTGVVIGLLAALGLTRLIRNLLFGVSAADPLTLGLIAALLTVVALLACWIPARRATKVDPLIALRHE
jgi:putative ABC transport system permease protein